jgi:hypothetical protein
VQRRLVLAATFLMAVGPAVAQSWTEYRTENGRFRAQLPGPPSVQKSAAPIGNNETAPAVEAVVRTPGATYQMATIAYPARVSQSASADRMLDYFRNNLSAGRTYRNEKTLTLGRVPGREFLLVEPNGSNSAVRLFWSRGTLYTLTVTGATGIETRPDTRRFLESFEAVPA